MFIDDVNTVYTYFITTNSACVIHCMYSYCTISLCHHIISMNMDESSSSNC